MTNTFLAAGPARSGMRSRRDVLASGLAFVLFAAGVTGGVLGSQVGNDVQIPRLSLMAAQETPVGTYSNSQASITVTKSVSGTGNDMVTAFVADITLTDPLALRSAFARNTFGKNITEPPSDIAESVGAVLAINGDYYGFRDNGIIIRNGVAYRDQGVRQGLAVHRDGTASIYDETRTTAAQLVSDGVWNTWSFGPGLVSEGRVLSGIDTYEIADFGAVQPGALGSIQGNQPRTGIGVVGPNHFVMIVVDGRSPGYSRGVTMPEFAQMFVDVGAQMAYNLDGGGSATMYFNGAVVNKPSQGGDDRANSDILYIAR